MPDCKTGFSVEYGNYINTIRFQVIALILFAMIFLNGYRTSAQDGDPTQVLQDYPLSPQASAIARYGNVPVNLSSGQIQFTVPIHQIQMDDFNWPVNLYYSYNGLLREGKPSEVGLGWNLNATGAVIREVRGLPDDHPKGYQGYENDRIHYIESYQESQVDMPLSIVEDFFNNKYDSEPDKFMVQAGNLSFSFYMDGDEPIITPYQNYKVDFSWDQITVTDDQAVTYVFSHKETNTFQSSYLDEDEIYNYLFPEYTSSWFLTKIIDNIGQEITFSYSNQNLESYSFSETFNKTKALAEFFELVCNTSTGGGNGGSANGEVTSKYIRELQHHKQNSFTLINQALLESIVFPNGRLILTRGTGTAVRPPRIEQIQLMHDTEIINDFALNYIDGNRDLLQEVVRNQEERHAFEYNPGLLPTYVDDKNDYPLDQDFWGYYNQAFNEYTAIPEKGADRYPKHFNTKTGSMKKITYPTGGYTNIEYEQNTVKKPISHLYTGDNLSVPDKANWRIKVEHEGVPFQNTETRYQYTFEEITFAKIWHEARIDGPSSVLNMQINPIGLNDPQEYDTYAYQQRYTYPADIPEFVPSLGIQLTGDIDLETALSNCGPGLRACESGNSGGWILILPGTYDFVINSLPEAYAYGRIMVDFYKYDLADSENEPDYIDIDSGGIRVSKTKDCTGTSSEPCVEKFYKYLGEDGYSSGIELGKLDYSYNYHVYDAHDCDPANFFTFGNYLMYDYEAISYNYRSLNPLQFHAGSPVYYPRVEVWQKDHMYYDGTAEHNGHIIYQLDDDPPNLIRLSGGIPNHLERHLPVNGKEVHHYVYKDYHKAGNYPYTPRPHNPFLGLEWKTEIHEYNPEDSTTSVIRETENVYENPGTFDESFDPPAALKMGVDYTYTFTPGHDQAVWEQIKLDSYIYASYNLDKTPSKLIRTRQIERIWESGDPIITTTDFEYDRKWNLSRSSFNDSRGDLRSTELTYAYDLGTTYNDVVSSNNVAQPLKTDRFVKGTKVATDQIYLNSLGTNPWTGKPIVKPSRIEKIIGEEGTPFTVAHFDYRGNKIAEVYKPGGMKTAYLWGHDRMLPILKAENASYLELVGQLGPSLVEITDMPDAEQRDLFANLRASLPAARITTFKHRPLVGVVEVTDPNGRAMRYEWDELNRLHLVWDIQKTEPLEANLLQMHTYNYDEGYQRTFTYKTERDQVLSESASMALNKSEVSVTTQYVDGLGRPEQVVNKEASPAGKDVVEFYRYDELGRTPKQYLPFTYGTEGSRKTDLLARHQDFYGSLGLGSDAGDFAFHEQVHERSPLNQVVEQYAPGVSWSREANGRAIKVNQRINVAADEVIQWEVIGDTFVHDGLYPAPSSGVAGSLIVSETTDENGFLSLEFTDKVGHVILKKQQKDDSTFLSTYYLYDDSNNLRFVIQPEGVRQFLQQGNTIVNQELIDRFCFVYEYDDRNRMVRKKVPGAEASNMVYDLKNRLILTQQGNDHLPFVESANEAGLELINEDLAVDQYQGQSYALLNNRSGRLTDGFHFTSSEGTSFRLTSDELSYSSEWNFTKYDVFDRPVQSGRVSLAGSREQLQNQVNEEEVWDESFQNSEGLLLYTNQAFPRDIDQSHVLSVNYYDGYEFTSETAPAQATTQVRGLPTGSKVRMLGLADFLNSVSFYDEQLRPIKVISDNHVGGEDVVTNTYFNKVRPLITESIRTQTAHGTTTSVKEDFDYDHIDRLLSVTHQVNDQAPVTLVRNNYNERGELVEKELSNDELSTSYQYNLRGWLTQINNGTGFDSQEDVFGMELLYDDAGQFNGNIGMIMWKTVGGSGMYGGEQTYSYTYDGASRLKTAVYTGQSNNLFNVGGNDGGIRYDDNGNIQNLVRRFQGDIADDLAYVYEGNQLTRVDDQATADPAALFFDGNTSGADYIYDANGNMTQDLNKDIIEIRYNYLNLPELVTKSNGDQIAYMYDAAGMKLRKVSEIGANTETTDYLGGFHYVNNDLKFLQHAEGRALLDGATFSYEYNMTDHLGNVRASVNQNGVLKQRDDYYPFGLEFNSWTSGTESQYKYNQGTGEKTFKTERQPELGVDFTKFRTYDYAIGRFWQVDPLSDAYPQESWTPYQYGYDNPVRYNDPYGDCPWCAVVAGAWEYGSQVYDNYQKGHTGADAWINNIDVVDVAVEAGAALIPGGKVVKGLVTVGTEIVKESLDIQVYGDVSYVGDGSEGKSVGDISKTVAINSTISLVGGKSAANKLKGASSDAAVKGATSAKTAATKNLQKSITVKNTGDLRSKATNPREAFNNLNSADRKLQVVESLNKAKLGTEGGAALVEEVVNKTLESTEAEVEKRIKE